MRMSNVGKTTTPQVTRAEARQILESACGHLLDDEDGVDDSEMQYPASQPYAQLNQRNWGARQILAKLMRGLPGKLQHLWRDDGPDDPGSVQNSYVEHSEEVEEDGQEEG